MRWRLFIEEYSPYLRYVPGDVNVVADALSRLEIYESMFIDAHFTEEYQAEIYCYTLSKKQKLKELA